MAEGWVKASKAALAASIGDKEALAFYVYCLLMADHDETTYRGVTVPRGSFITTLAELSRALGLSVQTVRRCIANKQNNKQINTQTTNKYTLITICSSAVCEDAETESQQATNKQNNKQTNKPIYKETIKKETIKKESVPLIYSPVEDAFQAYVAYRKEIRKPLRDSSLALSRDKLHKLSGGDQDTARRIVERTIENGWTGLFPLPEEKARKQPQQQAGRHEQIDRAEAEALRMIEAKYGRTN